MRIKFECSKKIVHGREEVDYSTSYFSISYSKNDKGLEFHTFSDKYNPITIGIDIITFFSLYVIAALTLFRSPSNTDLNLKEITNYEDLIFLCEGMRVYRHCKNFEKEEELYCMLIDMCNNSEILRKFTEGLYLNALRRKIESTNSNEIN